MVLAKDYNSVMARSEEIMKKTLGLDYSQFESGSIAFDYEGLMDAAASVYSLDDVLKMQKEIGVGNTPLWQENMPNRDTAPESSPRTKPQIHPVPLRIEERPSRSRMQRNSATRASLPQLPETMAQLLRLRQRCGV